MCSSVGFLGLVSSGLFVALLLFGVWDKRSVGGGHGKGPGAFLPNLQFFLVPGVQPH